MTHHADVVIVGGGIAGATLGGSLAAVGLGVVIVERESVFRDRVRGEGIHPWGVAETVRLGIRPHLEAAGANELPIWREYVDRLPTAPYHWADDSIDGLPEIGVSHPALQETLLSWAASVGAEVLRPATAVRVEPGPSVVVQSAGDERQIAARLVVGADGRRSRVGRRIGARLIQDAVHHRFGGALFDQVDLDAGSAHEARFSGGRMFLLPQGKGRARAYLVLSVHRLETTGAAKSAADFLRVCAEHFPDGAFADAVASGPVAFFPNADLWPDQIATDSVVLIGDAAGANDPSVGQGLSIVFRDVRELLDALLEQRDWSIALRDYASRRQQYYDVLRQHARWVGILTTEEGPEADRRRELVATARESDPSAGGFSLIFGRGPDGLIADEHARKRFFGESSY
jgi:2-polyprenyl-6-methoxyphenol hydroxylase-like FAD-dependent oxidoreductase